MCLVYLSLKFLAHKVYGPNLTVEILLIPNFIKILAQVINKISKNWQNKKYLNLCQNRSDTMI